MDSLHRIDLDPLDDKDWFAFQMQREVKSLTLVCVRMRWKTKILHLLLEVSVHSAMVNAIRIFQVSVIMQLLGSIIFFFSEIQYYMGGGWYGLQS